MAATVHSEEGTERHGLQPLHRHPLLRQQLPGEGPPLQLLPLHEVHGQAGEQGSPARPEPGGHRAERAVSWRSARTACSASPKARINRAQQGSPDPATAKSSPRASRPARPNAITFGNMEDEDLEACHAEDGATYRAPTRCSRSSGSCARARCTWRSISNLNEELLPVRGTRTPHGAQGRGDAPGPVRGGNDPGASRQPRWRPWRARTVTTTQKTTTEQRTEAGTSARSRSQMSTQARSRRRLAALHLLQDSQRSRVVGAPCEARRPRACVITLPPTPDTCPDADRMAVTDGYDRHRPRGPAQVRPALVEGDNEDFGSRSRRPWPGSPRSAGRQETDKALDHALFTLSLGAPRRSWA